MLFSNSSRFLSQTFRAVFVTRIALYTITKLCYTVCIQERYIMYHSGDSHKKQNYFPQILNVIHSVFCLPTGPKLLPKRFLHIVRSRASSFKWEYSLLSLRSSSSFLRLLPRLLVTSISPFIFPSIICFRRQFLRKMWPIQLAYRFRVLCRIFLCSLTLSNTSF
jgi:hypothetical protein